MATFFDWTFFFPSLYPFHYGPCSFCYTLIFVMWSLAVISVPYIPFYATYLDPGDGSVSGENNMRLMASGLDAKGTSV